MKQSLYISCIALAVSAASPTVSAQPADLIFNNGIVITMNDAQPRAEAVAVKGGKILAVGSIDDVMRTAGDETRMIDLEEHTLLPGFVDSHGHAYLVGLQATSANLLPPPDGDGRDIRSLLRLLAQWAEDDSNPLVKLGWIVGFGYDDSQLREERHPNRDDLDRISTERPILVIHQSGHLGAANSKALELAGVSAATENPPGGVYRRRPDSGEPNGVLEEYAFFHVMMALSASFDDEINDEFVRAGTRLLASYGYTTAQEGRAMGDAPAAMKRVADRGELPIDLVAYPDILAIENIQPSREYQNRYRVGGAKLTIDGSPQGKTAWLTEPYYKPPEGQPDDYVGYAAIDEATTHDAVMKAFANDWQILVHSNGDAASDRLIQAVGQARNAYPEVRNRPVLIHGQVLREDQVDEIKRLGIFPSLFPMHTYYWGDWHRTSVLGKERASNISPTGWLIERDMMFGTHHDAPVALPDSMRVLSATVTRRARSGRILGAQHRVPIPIALKAMTLWPAWQHFEEDSKGSIEVGKLADFVVLSHDPLDVPPKFLDDIKVLETYKEGVSVFKR